MVRVTIPLEREERAALMRLAEREKRDERQQAAWLIKDALLRLGLLQPAPNANTQKREAHRERA